MTTPAMVIGAALSEQVASEVTRREVPSLHIDEIARFRSGNAELHANPKRP